MATARARAILQSNARRVKASERRTENFVLRLERFLDRNLDASSPTRTAIPPRRR